jgi:hypothetical protein
VPIVTWQQTRDPHTGRQHLTYQSLGRGHFAREMWKDDPTGQQPFG